MVKVDKPRTRIIDRAEMELFRLARDRPELGGRGPSEAKMLQMKSKRRVRWKGRAGEGRVGQSRAEQSRAEQR